VSGTPAERYLRLGLQLGRHVDGIVDSYFGPPELAEAVNAGPLAPPRELVTEAESLLDELADGWLRDQVVGVRTFAGVLAGEAIAYADEVEQCYGVRPSHTDESVFMAAHEALNRLLPGDGALSERYESWRASGFVPAEAVDGVLRAVLEIGRGWARRHVELPADEAVVLELVRDTPWLGYCRYRGDFRSDISVNVDLPHSAYELLQLGFHETYPGHHTERCLKEQRLVRERRLLEETIVLLPTAQSLVAEGIAMLAPDLVLDDESAAAVAAVGVELDLERARAIARAREALEGVFVNAALLLYETGEDAEDVRAYVERWALATPERARHAVRFIQDPTSRSYVLTYSAGQALCRAYVAHEGDGLRRLLGEQVRVGELVANIRS
jgi:hypothetical protein